MYVNVWSSSTMLVLRLLWTYGLLMIFMIRSISSAPTNGSLPITIKLKEQLATKYGGLLKALISVNEQRMDVLQKLQRLQDLPLTVLRTKGPEVYAVWKLDTKPTLIEELLREKAHLIEAHSRNLAALIIVTDKAKSEESSSLEFEKGSPEIELIVSDEGKENVIDATITTTEKPKSEESSSLEFWEPSQEVLHSDGGEEKGINIVDVPITTTENPKSEESSSLEFWEPPQEVLHSNGDENEEINIIDVPMTTTEKPEIEDSGSLEFWKGAQEVLDSNESDVEEDEITNFKDVPTELVEKNLIIVPYLSPLSGSLEFFETSQETTKKYKDLRRYKYAKDCSKKATKYCKIACKEAFKKMCGRFKCTSEVKRNYKKQCHYMCLEEFVTDSEYFEC